MKITKLYIDSSLDFKLWNWKRIDEYPTTDGMGAEEVIGKYILAEGCNYIFGNVAAYAVSFDYTTVPEYDVVIHIGKTYIGPDISEIPLFKIDPKDLVWNDRIFPATFNTDIFNLICHCTGKPFIHIDIEGELSHDTAESYSGNGYYIITSPYELQNILHKFNISKNSKVLLLQLDADLGDDEKDTLTQILDTISVVENILNNWK